MLYSFDKKGNRGTDSLNSLSVSESLYVRGGGQTHGAGLKQNLVMQDVDQSDIAVNFTKISSAGT